MHPSQTNGVSNLHSRFVFHLGFREERGVRKVILTHAHISTHAACPIQYWIAGDWKMCGRIYWMKMPYKSNTWKRRWWSSAPSSAALGRLCLDPSDKVQLPWLRRLSQKSFLAKIFGSDRLSECQTCHNSTRKRRNKIKIMHKTVRLCNYGFAAVTGFL